MLMALAILLPFIGILDLTLLTELIKKNSKQSGDSIVFKNKNGEWQVIGWEKIRLLLVKIKVLKARNEDELQERDEQEFPEEDSYSQQMQEYSQYYKQQQQQQDLRYSNSDESIPSHSPSPTTFADQRRHDFSATEASSTSSSSRDHPDSWYPLNSRQPQSGSFPEPPPPPNYYYYDQRQRQALEREGRGGQFSMEAYLRGKT